jgi:hypothetical protein
MKPMFILCVKITFVVCMFLTGCASNNKATPQPLITMPPASPLIITSTFPPVDITTQLPPSIPSPTLITQYGLDTFTNLIRNDGNCNLPCWLGIVPGQTSFDVVNSNFSQFSSIAYTNHSSQWATLRVFFPDFETAIYDINTTVSSAENGGVSKVLVTASTYLDKNGPLDYNNPEFQILLQGYFLSGIFARHGLPEKIFLDTTRVAVDTTLSYPFVLWVVYSEQGFMMRYEGNNSSDGKNIKICPMQSKIDIKIWDTKILNYEEFIKGDKALATSLGPQAIETVTDFDIESFHEIFNNGNVDTCFETPTSLWPPN